jgi:hypothetical protein
VLPSHDWDGGSAVGRATRNARIKGQQTPADLNPDVTEERHYALNWLTGYLEQAWDDVSTDT